MRNKVKYLEYNRLRKELFAEYSPKDSELILYLLPWLLSVNHPGCPGFIPDLENGFVVSNVNGSKQVRIREDQFKDMFSVAERGSLLKPRPEDYVIEGLYTIGSIGTLSQTFDSDCDIWVCYDEKKLDKDHVIILHRKLYLIKEWFSKNCRIPVYFFVLDIGDVRNCRFGSVDDESSGSTQTHVLKEEFYRTTVLICGKVPLWWICFGPRDIISYETALSEIKANPLWEEDFIDMGNLENIEVNEYFGAALWQLNKALGRPLKSIIKMLMLKMQLDASDEELLCHKFRQHIMIKRTENMIPDPSVFSMFFILRYYQDKNDQETILFIKQCFYLRCGIKAYTGKHPSRKQLSDIIIEQLAIDRASREKLDRFSNWDLESQIRFGKELFKLLFHMYRDISKSYAGVASRIDKEDLTVIGRKIQIFYEVKDHKVPVLPKVMEKLNVSGLMFHLDSGRWQVYSGNARAGHLVAHVDILYVITFIVKNDLFDPVRMHMLPNRSSISLPEIQNVATKIRDFIHLDHEVSRNDYLKKDVIQRMLVVVSFEEQPWEKTAGNVTIIYKNSWGEVYVRRFHTEKRLREFVSTSGCGEGRVLVDYYLQRKCINYPIILSHVQALMKGGLRNER